MVLLDKLWDDVVAGPHPDKGLGKLRKITVKPINVEGGGEGSSSSNSTTGSGRFFQRSLSMSSGPNSTPVTPSTPLTPSTARNSNVWRSVFNPGSNLNSKTMGSNVFDKPQPNSPTVYDWLYSGETKSEHR